MIWLVLFIIGFASQGINAADTNKNRFSRTSTTQPYGEDTKEKLENGVANFAVQFGKSLQENSPAGKNILFSPTNLYTALALVHIATNGTTRSEIVQAMGFSGSNRPHKNIHNQIKQIIKQLENSNISQVEIGNGIFIQEGLKVTENFHATTNHFYDSDIKNVDFQRKGNEALKVVNDWVSKKTRGKMQDLFQEPFPADTQVVLGSCLYFNGKWKNGFPKERTRPGYFKSTGKKSEKTKVTMMNNQAFVPYIDNEEDGYEAITLTYENDYTMNVLLPYVNSSVEEVFGKITPEKLKTLVSDSSKETYNVNYTIPKMKFEWNKDIIGELTDAGIHALFNNADFSSLLDKPKKLKVSQVNHATQIEVEETGTVAVAATFFVEALSLGPSIPQRTVIFTVDRPFLFYIAHRTTKMVLFSGIVYQPVTQNQ